MEKGDRFQGKVSHNNKTGTRGPSPMFQQTETSQSFFLFPAPGRLQSPRWVWNILKVRRGGGRTPPNRLQLYQHGVMSANRPQEENILRSN